jgi:hypothetical protein
VWVDGGVHGRNAQISSERRIGLSLVAGGVAGAIAKTTIAPMDRVKILFQVSQQKFSLRLAGQMVVSIARKDGVLALWRGNSATVARYFVHSSLLVLI